ncbi:MAG: AGE family epimerase/isomerase [Lentisphaeria bacterium]|nr:AGE family epimerase/isomerase [Lentisphaeria bacterium]
MNENWQKYIERYEKTLTADVIPFWQKNCPDREFGGYFTSLDRDGSVYDSTKYMWMQWRIVYMFAEFYLSRYSKPEFLQLAIDGFEFLYKYGRDEKGAYYFALNRRGEPAMAPYNVFSECFAAMGCAMLYKATGEKKYSAAATEAMTNYTARIQSGNPAGRWNKAMPGKQEYLSLGHYMMLANLGLIMDDCLGGNAYRRELDMAFEMVLNKFYRPEYGKVFENILPDGSIDKESCQGRMLNPGHVLEAMWFLLNTLERYPRSGDEAAKICTIIADTLELGWDKKHGGIFYFMDAFGKPHLELQHDMKLWWPHNETLIASLFAYRHSGNELFSDWFRKLDRWTWSHFPDPDYGEWFAYLNRAGEVTHNLKGGKWKTFFHLPRCLAVCAGEMRKIAGE